MMMFLYSQYAQRHAFHLVDPSAMPLLTSISAMTCAIGMVMYFHGYTGGIETFSFGTFSVITCATL
jgi:hypothetical protein